MVSFEPKGGLEEAERLMQRLTLPILAGSLGGVETLVTRPVATSFAALTQEERKRLGISDRLIRLSTGIETTVDILTDLEQALAAVARVVVA